MNPILIIIAMILIGCGQAPNQTSTPKLYVYGDSITLQQESWAEQLGSTDNLSMVQRSIGSTQIQSLNQAPSLMLDDFDSGSSLAYAPGANDAAIYGEDPAHLEIFRSELTDIVNRMNTIGVKAYIGTPYHAIGSLGDKINHAIDVYASITREVLSHQSTARLVDFNTCFTPVKDDLIDNIHPNDSGKTKMFACLKEFI